MWMLKEGEIKTGMYGCQHIQKNNTYIHMFSMARFFGWASPDS